MTSSSRNFIEVHSMMILSTFILAVQSVTWILGIPSGVLNDVHIYDGTTAVVPGAFDSNSIYEDIRFNDVLLLFLDVVKKVQDNRKRIKMVLWLMLACCSLLSFSLLFSFFYAYLMPILLFKSMGTIFFLSLGFKIFLLIGSISNAFIVFVNYYWIYTVYTFVGLIMAQGEGYEKILQFFDPIIKRFSESNSNNHNLEMHLDGDLITARSLSSMPDRPLAIAVWSYWQFCPNRNKALAGTLVGLFAVFMTIFKRLYLALRLSLRLNFIFIKYTFMLILMCLLASDQILEFVTGLAITIAVLPFSTVYYLLFGKKSMYWQYVKTLAAYYAVIFMKAWMLAELEIDRREPNVKGFTPRKTSWRSAWNTTIMSISRTLDDIQIPNFLRTMPDRFDAQAINEANEIMKTLGWPSAPLVVEDPNITPANFARFAGFLIGSAKIEQGIRQLNLSIADEMKELHQMAPEYKRSETYANIENELESLSRYFNSKEVTVPIIPTDEIFLLVGSSFVNSKLTPFRKIISKWEKKYGLGPFWSKPGAKKWRKLSRREFISQIGGYKNFVDLWAKTFPVAHTIVPVAPISVKGEALPPKKWLNDMVRTVVGSPIAHYISSTIWNYGPNHNMKPWSTPSKVGMPVNGANISRLFEEHDTYAKSFQGDFKEFDSTVTGPIKEMIKNVRKKGFEKHRDYAKICYLIDANYANLDHMPLMTTSTGNIFKKGSGLSTGHSSTTPDNSLAVVILYLCAWKVLTGQSAHEFRFHCKLSCYGDNHILSYHSTAPAVWQPNNIMLAMKRMGVTLVDECPSRKLYDMDFLSKRARPATSYDNAMLKSLGLRPRKTVIYHDPAKLIGKATAPSLDVQKDRNYRAKRIISYLSLTAHHPEIYNRLTNILDKVLTSNKGVKIKPPAPIPTYKDVLTTWYNPASVFVEDDYDEDVEVSQDENLQEVLDYTERGLLDTFANIAAFVPDVLNPAIYNVGYTNYLVSLFASRMAWQVELIKRQNGILTDAQATMIVRQTPYGFLADSPVAMKFPVDKPTGVLLFKHWMALLVTLAIPKVKFANKLLSIDAKISSFNFILNGFVTTDVRRLDIPFVKIAILTIVGLLPDWQAPEFLTLVKVPSFSAIVEYFYGTIINMVWSHIPANFKQLHAALEHLGNDISTVLAEAPTGTGKSTTMVAYIMKSIGHKYDRVVLIEPRAILPETLVPYLINAFGLDAAIVNETHPFSPNHKLIVTTAQEVILHPNWVTSSTLFILDECHVEESAYLAVSELLRRNGRHLIYSSATPNKLSLETCDVHVKLTIANSWSVKEVKVPPKNMGGNSTFRETSREYMKVAIDLVNAYPRRKFLVFVNDKSEAYSVANSVKSRTCILSSDSKIIDAQAQIFIATSVADVGLTIPSVDWVITSNIITKSKLSNGEIVIVRCVLDNLTLNQRRGRTGRTNNGFFTIVKFTGISNFASEPPGNNILSAGKELLLAGLPPTSVFSCVPGLYAAIAGTSGNTNEESFREHLVLMEQAMSGMSPSPSSITGLDSDVKGKSVAVVHGNTIQTALAPERAPPDREGFPDYVRRSTSVATTEQLGKMMVSFAKWASEQTDQSEFNTDRYNMFFRLRHISYPNFIKFWNKKEYDNYTLKTKMKRVGDETGRFSRYSEVGMEQAVIAEEELYDLTLNWA
ncbi:replicase [Agaricus bisporus virus 10]|uniref:Replicase n=1 Tax=Agaricus bisporus virus 10 TaxID=1945740 RepID=A0AAC9Q5Q8_9VIRU|nr:replicase [Agaricus bisporus virus 10]AQM49936.1 replicase [Agaricus bisporus virus 10]